MNKSRVPRSSLPRNSGANALPLSDRPGFLIRRLHQIHLTLFAEECGRYGATPVQYSVLTALQRHGPLDQVSLAAEIGIDRATMTGVVTRLEEKELVQRVADPADARVKLCGLTTRGRRLTTRMARAVERCHERTIAALPAPERKVFLQSLVRLVRANNSLSRTRLRIGGRTR